MRVAYLINQYPEISHTFVRREIQALERLGVAVARFAVRPSKQATISPEDEAEARLTRHIVSTGKASLAVSALRGFAAAPARALAAFARALRMGARSEAGLGRHLLYYIEALVLADWLRAEKLPHVHAHFGTNSATVAMLAAGVAGVGFSMTVHGPEEFDKPALIALPQKIEAARFVVAVSQFGRSQLRRLVAPALWERIKVVRCGVEKDFYEGAIAPARTEPVFVSVGRLCEQKGQITLVEAAGALKREGRAFTVRFIGDGPMRADIEAAAKSWGVEDEIVIAGWKTPAEVRAEIERCRAFVLPSYAEGLPVSIMEAMLLERPVISTYVAGIPELVRPGVNGWLAPAGDAQALARVMGQALDAAPDEIAEMGRAGRRDAAAMHDIDREAQTLKDCFEDALAAGART